MRRWMLVLACLPCFAQAPSKTATNEQLLQVVTELYNRLAKAEAKIAKHEKDIGVLQAYDTAFSGILDEFPSRYAVFAAGDNGHVIARSKSGHLVAISMRNAAVYPGGHKVTFVALPLSAATLTGVELVVEYSQSMPTPTTPNTAEKYLQWLKKSKKRTNTGAVYTLPGGRWTELEVVLPASKPEEMERFSVEVNVGGILPSN